MPTSRSQLYRAVACDASMDTTACRLPLFPHAKACEFPPASGSHAHNNSDHNTLSHNPLDLLGLSRQRIAQLEMEVVESSRKLLVCEQQSQATVEVAQRQNELVLAHAQKEVAHMTAQLIQAQQGLKLLTEQSQSAQHALIHELNDLAHSVLRLDTQVVLQDSTSITVNELDAQLEWHRRWSGEAIPRSGKKKVKIQRWVKAVDYYKARLQARLDGIHATVGHIGEEEAAGAESSDLGGEPAVDRMDVD